MKTEKNVFFVEHKTSRRPISKTMRCNLLTFLKDKHDDLYFDLLIMPVLLDSLKIMKGVDNSAMVEPYHSPYPTPSSPTKPSKPRTPTNAK